MNNWTVWCTQERAAGGVPAGPGRERRADLAARQNGQGDLAGGTARHRFRAGAPLPLPLSVLLRKACRASTTSWTSTARTAAATRAQYYRHAGLCLFGCLDLLKAASRAARFWTASGTPNLQHRGLHFKRPRGRALPVNFSDCSPVAERCGAGSTCSVSAPETMISWLSPPRTMPLAGNRICRGEQQPVLPPPVPVCARGDTCLRRRRRDAPSHPDIYYPSAGLFIARTTGSVWPLRRGTTTTATTTTTRAASPSTRTGGRFFIDLGVRLHPKTFSPAL